MREAVVVASCRTPLAKSFTGSLNRTRSDDMTAHVIREVVKKVPQLAPQEIQDVVIGCAEQQGLQALNLARLAAMRAGLPVTVAGATINRFCASGLQAIAMAAHEIIHEGADAAIGGGVESITAVHGVKYDLNPWLVEHHPGLFMIMGDTAEIVAKRYNVSREAQDEFAFSSQQRTARAQAEGLFEDEIAPMKVHRAIVDRKTFQVTGEEDHDLVQDECNRPDTTLNKLLKLKPHFDPASGHGTVTAGNSSQMSDGASATLLMSRERAEQLGIRPKLIYRGFNVAGCEPDEMGVGPIYAVPRLLKRFGLKVDDIDLWELNEAFAVQAVYCRDKLGIDPAKLNVNGGSISIGHPYGMTGSRLVGHLASEMPRRKVRWGVVTMCIGGGQGAAGLFETYS